MKSALSIRYGGLLVEALECDYQSFKHLGLLCPICKRSVFLVATSNREMHSRKRKDGTTTQVKECVVPAHFNHHQDVSESEILECELRSAQMSTSMRLAIVAKARGQRAKIMQRHFWKICKTSCRLTEIDGIPQVMEAIWEKASIRSPMESKRLYQLLIESLIKQFRNPRQLEHTKATLGRGMEKWVNNSSPDFLPENVKILIKLWRQKLDLRMQEMIVLEALDFVVQKMQQPILSKLVENALYCLLLSQAVSVDKTEEERLQIFNNYASNFEDATDDQRLMIYVVEAARRLIGMDKDEFETVFCFVRDDVVQSLVMVDWAGQFEKLEKVDLWS